MPLLHACVYILPRLLFEEMEIKYPNFEVI